MKTKRLFLIPALMATVNLLPAGRLPAQTFTTLHSFAAGDYYDSDFWWTYTNSDGIYPNALILSGNTLYGAGQYGGRYGSGALFAVNTDGTGFTNLHNFGTRDYHGGYVPDTNPDGMDPNGLTLSGNTLYGTAGTGGRYGGGSLFGVKTDGTVFTNLYDLPAGFTLGAGVILSGNTLYGTTDNSVFAANRNGAGLTSLHNFTAVNFYTNSDGAGAMGLMLSGSRLYGTASAGGSSGNGTLFAVNTNGAGFTNLHSFTATHTNSAGVYTNSDGADPEGGLVLSGNTLFGAARYGGSSGAGTVFAINTNGTGFTILHSFTAGVVYYGTNSDGANPAAGLILSGNTLYGTASAGGNSGHGTLFAIKTDGTGFTNLHSFSGGSDGANPQAGLVLSGDTLYGTARGGGSAGVGTVFSLSFAPQLTITPSGPNVILSWPTNVAGFDYTGFALQCSAGLSSTNWTNWMNPVTTSGGYYFVSNPISAGAQFFRLKK